jgi:hypothetical protein
MSIAGVYSLLKKGGIHGTKIIPLTATDYQPCQFLTTVIVAERESFNLTFSNDASIVDLVITEHGGVY